MQSVSKGDMKCQCLFSEKEKKKKKENYFRESSAVFFPKSVSVEQSDMFIELNVPNENWSPLFVLYLRNFWLKLLF